MKFQLGVSKFQVKVSFPNFEISDQSFEVRARMNRFDRNVIYQLPYFNRLFSYSFIQGFPIK